jgi:hypothetical protein
MMKKGFTIVEVLVGSCIMLLVIMLTLSLYTKTNKVAVDQMQLAEIQHDVRAGMYFVSDEIKMAGSGLPEELSGYFIEGIDGYSPGEESADAIKIMGNTENPLSLKIETYSGGAGGGAATAFLYDGELENNPYLEEFYENKVILMASTTYPGCFAYRTITNMFGFGEVGVEKINMSPGLAEFNPPGGLIDTECPPDAWIDSIVTFGQVKQFWLDSTGIPEDYPNLNLSVGTDGYMGIMGTLYMTTMDEFGSTTHLAIAQNIENLQFQYLGDLDYDGYQDVSVDWDDIAWTINPLDDFGVKLGKLDLISRIRGVRIWVLGKTTNPFVSRSGSISTGIHHYRRPAIANSLASADDNHKRFLLETTSSIKNHNLDFYSLYIAVEDATLKVRTIREVK